MDTSRRQFISALGQLLLFPAVASLSAGTVPDIGKGKKVTFGIISDIHKGLQKDAERRLGIFIDKAIEKRPDFIIQLGDMTHGKPEGFKVIASICGHHHIDNHKVIEGVQYIQINSASYFWIGHAAAFSNGHMAEYKHPLFAFITLDSEAGTIEIKGTQSEFLPPVPIRENYPQADKLYPGIKDRVIVYR
jgi:hypothetical protein